MEKIKEKISVIIPTYNEKGNIVLLCNSIFKILRNKEFEIIVVDDNSPDKTLDYLKKNINSKNVKTVLRTKNPGLAKSIKRGIKKSEGGIIIIMDADFNHHPEYLPKLICELKKNDVAIGSRFIKGGGMEGSKFRYYGSFLLNMFIKIVLNLKTRENSSGFLAIKRSILKKLDLDEIFEGYGDYNITLFKRMKEKDIKISEVPVVYRTRIHGISKTKFIKHLFQYFKTTMRLKWGIK